MIKKVIAFSLCAAASFVWAGDAFSKENGLKDTPYFSGIPGYEVIEAQDTEFGTFRFCASKGSTAVEGRVWRKMYNLKEGAKQSSDLQIIRNYANAVKKMGGTVLYDGDGCEGVEVCSKTFTGKIAKEGKELWVAVAPCNDGFDFWLTVIEKGEMKQDVSARDMLDALNKDGHIALYINFDSGKATVKPESAAVVDQIAAMLKSSPSLKISVEGHTDNSGDPKKNKTLSEERAKSVVAALVKQGIDAKRLQSAGYGQANPVADNRTEEGRAKNRRVELVKK